jgi:hypothetical protein
MWFLSALFRRSPPAAPPAPFRENLAIQQFRMPELPPPARPVEPIRPADYFDGSSHRYRRVHPVELIDVHTEVIDQIYQATGMDRLAFRKRVWPMLEYAAAVYQLVPASANNHHREPGGLLLHSLQVARHAAHLGQFARFETDRTRFVSPEDHRAWTVGLILAALTHDAGKMLTDFRVVHPSFFAPGRLLPRLDNGAPPEDERALFVPYDDTIFQWLDRYHYREYAVHWLPNRYGNHQAQSLALVGSWLHRMPWIVLPEKVRRALATGDPRSGTVEADFWDIVTKADHRSATQYFPAVPGDPGAIIADTLRRLVRDGAWRPAPDSYPLCVADNQRLLLRDPIDLSQLAVQILQHPQSYVLSAEGPLPVDALVTHLHFASLVEINPATEARFASSAVVSGSTTTQRVVVLNETLSRELLELALSAPPAQTPATPPPAAAAVDLRYLSEPVPAPPPAAAPSSAPVATAPARPTPAPSPPTPQPERLVSDFLDHLRSLRPAALFELDRAGQPRPPSAPGLDDLRFESASGGRIVVGRNVVKRFKQRRPDNLDAVFYALTRCTALIERVDPPPPRPTSYLTLTGAASAAVLRRSATIPAQSPAPPPVTGDMRPSPSKATPLAHSTPPPRPVSTDMPAEIGLALSLLANLFAQPSVDGYFREHGPTGGLNIRTSTLAAAIELARREDPAIPQAFTADAAAQMWVRCGLPVEVITGGVRLLPGIQRYWDFHVENQLT